MSKSLIPQAFQTDRLTIRAPRPGDGVAVHQAVVESLAALRAWPAYLPWAMHTPSPDASEQFCRQGHAAFLAREDFPMLIFLKDQDVLVGATGLHRLSWDVPKCEIGYWGRSSFARQGLITEAVTGIAQFAFQHLGVLRIKCLTDAANQASRAVAERAGFALESVMRHERRSPDGSLRDTCVYAKAPPT